MASSRTFELLNYFRVVKEHFSIKKVMINEHASSSDAHGGDELQFALVAWYSFCDTEKKIRRIVIALSVVFSPNSSKKNPPVAC